MFKLICCAAVQCLFLASGQVFLKFGLEKAGKFTWTWTFFRDFLTNPWMLASGLSMVAASVIWFYILKHHDLSLAYPLVSISYIFGTLAAVYIFHETVPLTRWVGVLFIMIGVAFLTRPA
ncbi:MAG: EamA family transporter [Tannerella sp.]|jgi:undecaprenyl phosphate-alpha-L-ara4N flippase subunit ArnE|nr:EamA family transporter [Tannerella sp.]